MEHIMRFVSTRIIALLSIAVLGAACTVQETEAPVAAGPSELALSLAMEAAPAELVQDGVSQASVRITARGPNGQPARGVSLRIETFVDGSRADFGTLSSSTVTTGDDGIARLVYTVPPRPSAPVQVGSLVTLTATPISTDARGDISRQVDIRVVPMGVIVGPNGIAAGFTYSPTTVTTNQTVHFDAAPTTDRGVRCGNACSYSWSFGDGSAGTGLTATHVYRAAGTYVVQLTATNVNGQSGQSTPQTVTVAAAEPPTAAFTFSPQSPEVGQDVFFNAGASTVPSGSGRRIVSYDWDFGNGRTGSGVTTSQRYSSAGSFRATLTVTDDAAQTGTQTQSVTVGGGLVAQLIFSPQTPRPGRPVSFDARGSRMPAPIVRYQFDYGNGIPSDWNNTVGYSTATFPDEGTYVVRLTVFDAAGRSASTTVTVTVAEPETP
ncbi:MAG: PKD domain-containing protein [Acidobacteria bacterium]|nr:PKD domain-containing protein [Acidobacteriota bacterium]